MVWQIWFRVALLPIAGYLIKEAWENYREKRWLGFWLDIAALVPIAGYLLYAVGSGVLYLVRHWRNAL